MNTADPITVEDLEKAVETLSPENLARFRAWFEQFDATLFDARIARDAADGMLDKALEKSEANFRGPTPAARWTS